MNGVDQTVVAVFGASKVLPGEPAYESGVECGRLLSKAGFVVATGGYGGQMEAACKGAKEAGGHTIGITAPSVFPGRSGANQWIDEEIQADDLIHRISLLASLSSGYIAMPGSLGTLAEMVIVWNLALVAPFSGKTFGPIVAVGDTWQRMVPHLVDELDSVDGLVTTAGDVTDAVGQLCSQLATES